MNLINTLLGVPLGHVMRLCHALMQNYGLAIILFAILARIILFPISVIAQKNAVKMARLQPKLEEIKRRYAGDKDRITEEQVALFKKEKYNPVFGIFPLLLQIPLILGLINVIYNPLQHLLRMSQSTIWSCQPQLARGASKNCSAYWAKTEIVACGILKRCCSGL